MESSVQWERLVSRNGETVRFLSRLQMAKYRKEYGLFLAEGVKLASESLGRMTVRYALVTEEAAREKGEAYRLAEAAGERGARVFEMPSFVFEKISTETAPQGLIFVLENGEIGRETTGEETLSSGSRALLLSEIRDPGNLGTVLRSADAFGITDVFLSSCVELTSPKTVRASMGALFRVRTWVTPDLPALIRSFQFRKRRILGTALTDRSKSLGSFDLLPTDAFLIGNEGHGLSPEILGMCDEIVRIPMMPDTESLNAASAATVLLWEAFRTHPPFHF